VAGGPPERRGVGESWNAGAAGRKPGSAWSCCPELLNRFDLEALICRLAQVTVRRKAARSKYVPTSNESLSTRKQFPR
jgi:hypothetical protein